MAEKRKTPPARTRPWVRVGYVLTALWFIYVLEETDFDRTHPMFDYIFIVPLGGWILGMIAVRVLGLEKQAEEEDRRRGE